MESSLGVRKGPWAAEEDLLLRQCVEKYGEGKWHHVPLISGLKRCRKSCRLRWLNYLRPDLKRGQFASDEVDLIIRLHKLLGNRWTLIAGRLPGRTANDIKNYWNTHMLKKQLSLRKEVKADTQKIETTFVDTNQSSEIMAKFPLADSKLWWENGLFEREENKGTSCSLTWSMDELFSSLWVEGMEPKPKPKEGDIFVKEGNNVWDDLCFDSDLWG